MKKISLVLVPVLAGILGAAQAQTAAPAAAPAPDPSPLTANVNLTSNYKFRGQDQGTLKYWSPAIQGGFDWTQNGFYLGNWDSNVSFGGDIEMDLYGGYRGEITKDLTYDVGILQYYYPHNGGTNFNTTEIYGLLSYSFFTLKYSSTVSGDYFGIGESEGGKSGRNTGYLDLSGNYEVVKGVTLNGHVGYTHLKSGLSDAAHDSYVDYKAGATYDLGSGYSVAGALIGASKKSVWGDANKSRLVLTVSKSM
jgi:uncharacterized protein (TIGR02001 family)